MPNPGNFFVGNIPNKKTETLWLLGNYKKGTQLDLRLTMGGTPTNDKTEAVGKIKQHVEIIKKTGRKNEQFKGEPIYIEYEVDMDVTYGGKRNRRRTKKTSRRARLP